MRLVVTLIAFCVQAAAVTPDEANQSFQAQDWSKAAAAYSELTKQDAASGFYFFRLGIAQQNLKQPQEALDALTRAKKLKYRPIALYVRGTVLLANLKQTDTALQWLEELFASGFSPGGLSGLPALAELQKDERYRKLAERFANPCERPEAKAMSFWHGTYEVRNPQGQVVGHNRVERILGNCALQENWTSAGGGEGKSFTWFDTGKKKWRQVYLDASGRSHDYYGEPYEGGVRFQWIAEQPDGAKRLVRMTFTPREEGKVRQFLEESWDDGKNWTTQFDGLYIPKP
jgi:tetratricopeptide (TPR) repeat protein